MFVLQCNDVDNQTRTTKHGGGSGRGEWALVGTRPCKARAAHEVGLTLADPAAAPSSPACWCHGGSTQGTIAPNLVAKPGTALFGGRGKST
mmetsp:Transcript_35191/g.72492  ORF Transcript_35191/g.72492 Transcript_35191/m.72492 type:complete len:91 (-) Transcript_35191:181-453(-)